MEYRGSLNDAKAVRAFAAKHVPGKYREAKMKKRKPAQGLVHNQEEPDDDAEYEGEEQEGVGEAGEKEKGLALSRKFPNKKITPRAVKVETGLPVDRNRGYRKNLSRVRFTGADARAALVGAYEKKRSAHKRGAFMKSGRRVQSDEAY